MLYRAPVTKLGDILNDEVTNKKYTVAKNMTDHQNDMVYSIRGETSR
jgi:hypothetical protein